MMVFFMVFLRDGFMVLQLAEGGIPYSDALAGGEAWMSS